MIKKMALFFGNPLYARRRWQLFIALLLLTVIADFLVTREHGEFFWEAWPGWSAFFGFISCLLIVFVSKFLGHRGKLMQREDYYDR